MRTIDSAVWRALVSETAKNVLGKGAALDAAEKPVLVIVGEQLKMNKMNAMAPYVVGTTMHA